MLNLQVLTLIAQLMTNSYFKFSVLPIVQRKTGLLFKKNNNNPKHTKKFF